MFVFVQRLNWSQIQRMKSFNC